MNEQASSARGVEPATPSNPYLSARQPEPVPDLDAGPPLLRPVEQQRINRKAVGFLVGIVLFLVLMTLWMVHSATAGKDAKPRQREEAVVIPELPRVSHDAATAAPAVSEIAQAQDVPPLPMLPPPPADALRPPSPQPLVPTMPTLMERRMGVMATDAAAVPQPGNDPAAQALLAGLSGLPGMAPPVQGTPPATTHATSAQFLQHPDALLARGTYVRCILESRIVTDVPGFAACVVTEPVYSVNGQRLLLPRGSKVSGRYDAEPTGPRVAVTWDRITTPDGVEVTMASPGVDGLGSAGHPGDYDAHWGNRIGAALMISLISDGFRYAAAEHGPETTTVANGVVTQSPFESTTAHTMERLANQALAETAHRPATVTIPQGTLLNVYVAKDVDFSGVLARP